MNKIDQLICNNPHVFQQPFRYKTTLIGYEPGVFGCKTYGDPSFSDLCHEIAHGIVFFRKNKRRLRALDFGFRIKTTRTVAGQLITEPKTLQASLHECETIAIQNHLMRACEVTGISDNEWAEILFRWMPDWFCGNFDSKSESIAFRASSINSFYEANNQVDVIKDMNAMFNWLNRKKIGALED